MMHKLKKYAMYPLLFFAALIFAFPQSMAETVNSAPISSSPTAKNGMVRVYLSSIGSLTGIDITVAGSYSVSGSTSFSLNSGEKLNVSMNRGNGSLTMTRGGSRISMGKEIVLRRHQTAGYNGLKISQTRQPDNIYPGDLYLRSVQNGSTFKLYAIVHVYMENYLEGVVPYEMGDSAGLEALKAQTVAARTYTLTKMNQRKSMTYDMVDTVNDQVYYGNSPNTKNCTAAVEATRGIVLMYGDNLAATYYSASNGGQTESAQNLWNMKNVPYLTVKNDPFDLLNMSTVYRKINVYSDASSPYQDSTLMNLLSAKVQQAYGYSSIMSINDINPHTAKYSSPSELYTRLDFDLTIQGSGGLQNVTVTFDIFKELEKQLGMSINASENELWTVDKIGGNFTIYARRFGHGIGMSQRGAMQMASMGYTYDQILGFYYPGCYRLQYVMTHTVMSPLTSGGSTVLVQSENPAEISAAGMVTASVVLPGKSGSLPVRLAPDNDGKVLTSVINGGLVSLLSTDGVWSKIKLGDIVGFVPAACLSYSEQPKAAVSFQPTDISQWATVVCSGTLNLRDAGSFQGKVIGQIPQGSALCVFGTSSGWAKVQYGAMTGFVSSDFLTFSDTFPGEITPLTGKAKVKAPNPGETVNLRSTPSTSGTVIGQMIDGAGIDLISMDSSWCQITYNGVNGFVMTKFVTAEGAKKPESVPTATPQPAAHSFKEAVVYTVSTGLNFRNGPSTSAGIIAVIPRSESVAVIGSSGDWPQIRYGGATGYVSSAYLKFKTEPASEGRTAYVVTPGGPLNMRTNPTTGSGIVVQIPENSQITVFDTADGWSRIRYQSFDGFAMSKFIGDSLQGNQSDVGNAVVNTKNGGLNLRELADASSRVLTIIPQGTRLTVTKNDGQWCNVSYNGKNGFVMAKFLTFNQNGATLSPSVTDGAAKNVFVNTDGGGLNLREKPDSNSRVLCVIPFGRVLQAKDVGSGWLSVKYNGISGFIMEKFTGLYSGEIPEATPQITAPPAASRKISTFGRAVSLLASPEDNGRIIMQIPDGTDVQVIASNGSWCYVLCLGQNGYLPSNVISGMEQTEKSDFAARTVTVSTNGDALNLRQEPYTGSLVLAKIPNGTEVELIQWALDWCKVRYGEITGFCSTEFLKTGE